MKKTEPELYVKTELKGLGLLYFECYQLLRHDKKNWHQQAPPNGSIEHRRQVYLYVLLFRKHFSKAIDLEYVTQ